MLAVSGGLYVCSSYVQVVGRRVCGSVAMVTCPKQVRVCTVTVCLMVRKIVMKLSC